MWFGTCWLHDSEWLFNFVSDRYLLSIIIIAYFVSLAFTTYEILVNKPVVQMPLKV
jgi:hypothetical protein